METSCHMPLTIFDQRSGLFESINKILIRIIKKTTRENKGSAMIRINMLFGWIELPPRRHMQEVIWICLWYGDCAPCKPLVANFQAIASFTTDDESLNTRINQWKKVYEVRGKAYKRFIEY